MKDLPETDPVKILLPIAESDNSTASAPPSYCGYWDEAAGLWSDSGCWVHEVTADTLVCHCTHLTLFGGFLEAFVKTLDCSNRPDQVFSMLLDLPREAWAPASVLYRTWLPFVVLLVAASTVAVGVRRD